MSFADIKLGTDSIKEALCELRFESPLPPEIVVGRLTDAECWRGFKSTRLPAADLPAQIRNVDANMRFQPTYELTSPNSPTLSIKVGPNVISCHLPAPYAGWEVFRSILDESVQTLLERVSANIVRIGFRYINALNAKDHYIAGAHDLDIDLKVGSRDVTDSFVLNYRVNSNDHITQTNVATPDYVNGPPGETFTAIVDIDVFTPPNYQSTDRDHVMSWIDIAHDNLKEQFFTLLPDTIIEKLRST